jgi:hypothetical protein
VPIDFIVLRMRHISFLFCFLLVSAGCYGRPETDVWIKGSEVKLGCRIVAVSVMKKSYQYPIFGHSGWGRGVSRTISQQADIYFYDIENKDLKKVANIQPPRGWEEQFEVSLGWWEEDGLYLILLAQERSTGRSLHEYRKLRNDGKVVLVDTMNPVPAEVSEVYKVCTAFAQRKEVTIGPTGGPWKSILYLDEKQELKISVNR